jgi:hypothetical protein
MGAWSAVLDPPDVEHGAVEVDLVPAQIAGLGGPQAVPEGDVGLDVHKTSLRAAR